MKILFLVLTLLAGIAGWANPAYADLDQLCLKQCVNNGSMAGSCMTQCSYGMPTTATVPTHPAAVPASALAIGTASVPDTNLLSPHRVLDAPVVTDNAVILAPKAAAPPPSEDYACLHSCLQQGQAYGQCEQSCVKVDCASSMTLCRDQTTTSIGSYVSGMVTRAVAR